MGEKISIWLVGNTGLRNPLRITDGLRVFAASKFNAENQLHERENEVAFMDLLNEKLNSQNDDIIIDSEFLSNEQFTSSSNSYSFDDYVELQKEYISLLKKYERSQEDLYNEKVKVIHYKNLLDKFKNFILRIQ